MTSHTRTLQAVLDGLSPRVSRRDFRARQALRVALNALLDGETEQQAIERVRSFLGTGAATPAAPVIFPPERRPHRD